ncbi:hypothetical protein D3C79_661850 [compost metagenome]
MPGFFTVVQGDEDAEFVAAETGNHILTAGRRLDVAGDNLEQLIASIMTEAVIDAFEMINVEEHHRQHALIDTLLG